MDLKIADLTRNSFLTAMDFVCYDDEDIRQIRDFTQAIDDTFHRQWRKMHPLKPGEAETVAYNLTSVLFFGISCSLLFSDPIPEDNKKSQKKERSSYRMEV
ncbi:hypothetical protein DRO03_07585 [Methanosarcinales archaeon]|nr:MAG: hypothetical protein DRO03_07585 [Methanosarcinales archaeon]